MINAALVHALFHVCQIAAAAAMSITWEAALLAFAIALSFRFLPTLPAALRSAAWTAVLIVSVLLLPFGPAWMTPSARTSLDAAPVIHLDPRWSLAFVGLWLSLSTTRAVGLLSSAFRLRRIRRRATPVASVNLLPLSSGGRRRAAVLCTSDDVSRPSVLGFLKPRILIPSGLYARLSAPDLSQIVLHEQEHLRRRDDWVNLLQKIALVMFPLNPVLLWVERRLCLERELACDEGVLRATRSPRSYAACLVNLAQDRVRAGHMSLALGAWGRRSELVRRVHDILQLHGMELRGETMSRRHAVTFTSLLIMGLVAGSTALARSPQLVSFAAPAASPSPVISAAVAPRLHYQHASFPDASTMKPRLVDAVMRLLPPSTVDRPATLRRAIRTRTSPHQAHQCRVLMRDRLLLSSWNQVTKGRSAIYGARRISVAFLDPSSTTFSYAAVPTPAGWLIVQL